MNRRKDGLHDFEASGEFGDEGEKPPRLSKGPLIAIGVSLFVFSVGILYLMYRNAPKLDSEQHERLKIPLNLGDVRDVADLLNEFTDEHFAFVMAAFGAVYLFLQTFSIPGSVFLSFLGGALFGIWIGVPYICLLSTLGATGSYGISTFLLTNLIKKFFPAKLALFADELAKHRNNILNYILFLRITPLLPNWFINLASPILDVPLKQFMIGTFFGVMPATYLAVNAGLTLQSLQSPRDIFDVKAILSLAGLAALSVLPTLPSVKARMNKILGASSNKLSTN